MPGSVGPGNLAAARAANHELMAQMSNTGS